jgi:hypothetical protein
MTYKFYKRLHGVDFFAPSVKKFKKYDAFVNGKMYSFGDRRYEHYNDSKLGYYKDYNHYDKQRRANYKARHQHDKLNTYSSAYFSMKYLW